MPPGENPLDLLPPHDPSFAGNLSTPTPAATPPAPTPPQAQRWQAPQQTAPAPAPAPEQAPVSREEFEAMMDLIASGPAVAAPAPQPEFAPVPTPAPSPAPNPNFALRSPTININAPTVSPEEFERIRNSPEAFAAYTQKLANAAAQEGANQTFAQIGPAVQAAAAAAVRSQTASLRAVEQWLHDNPDFEHVDEGVLRSAIDQSMRQYPTAPVRSQLFFATRLMRQALKQNAAIESGAPTPNRGAPGVTPRPTRVGASPAQANPSTRAFIEMVAAKAGKSQLEQDLRL